MSKTIKRLISALTGALLMAAALVCCIACGAKTVTGIEIATPPTKTDYIAGEKFDPTGMVVNVVYEGDEKEALAADAYTLSPSAQDALTTSNRTVTVTYEKDGQKYTAKQNIVVHNNVTEAVIKSGPTKTAYTPGESFDPTGMVVTATYEDGTTKDVEITSSNAQFKTEPLTSADTDFVVTFGGKELHVTLTIEKGVFIEAETAIIDAGSPNINTDSEEASGGAYVGNMFSGDSITFKFKAAEAGKADIAFILSSVYLKRALDWTPIEMGDCQFNKIVTFSVNDKVYPIPDTAILPGGIAENEEEGDQSLWFNWKEVVFEDVDVKAGVNSVKLTFIPHDYESCQPSFNKKFGANIDCLRVISDVDCSLVNFGFTVTSSSVEEKDGNVILNIAGTVEGYDQSSFTVSFGAGMELPLAQFDYNEAAGTFKATVNLATLKEGSYTAISLVTKDDSKLLTTTSAGGTFSNEISTYTVGKSESGNLTIEVTGGAMYKVTAAKLEVKDDKPCYILTGELKGYTEEDFALDFTQNNTWASYTDLDRELSIDDAAHTFTLTVDISGLAIADNVYYPHFKLKTESGSGAGDVKVANGVEATIGQSITVGDTVYTLDDSAFGCVGVKITSTKITSTKNYQNVSVSLEVKNNKPYLVINGTYAQYEKTELETALKANLYADTQNMPKVDDDESTDAWDDSTKVVVTDSVIVEVADNGTYKIYIDLSQGEVGQALFSHFSLKGETGNNLANLTKSETSITVGGKTYTFVDMSPMSGMGDAWSWANTLIVVKISAAS